MKRLLGIACLCLSCGSSGGTHPSAGSGGQGGAGASFPGAAVCAGGQATTGVDLSGQWAYLEVQSSLVQAPAYAEPFSNLVISLMLLDQTQDGTQIAGQGTFCDRYTFCTTAPTSLPDALVRSLPAVNYSGSYAPDGSFGFGPMYQVLGATLADPADSSNLPTSQDDPRVIDQEQDGMPGATIVLERPVSGKMYVVQWSRVTPHGSSVGSDRIQGLIDYESKQVVLASDPALIKGMSPTTSVDPDSCKSTFQMVRVPANYDCTQMRADELTLFPDLVGAPHPNG